MVGVVCLAAAIAAVIVSSGWPAGRRGLVGDVGPTKWQLWSLIFSSGSETVAVVVVVLNFPLAVCVCRLREIKRKGREMDDWIPESERASRQASSQTASEPKQMNARTRRIKEGGSSRR